MICRYRGWYGKEGEVDTEGDVGTEGEMDTKGWVSSDWDVVKRGRWIQRAM